MKKDPEVSVVIPVYNESRRIEKSLKEILGFLDSQDYSFEVVVSDDGSTDTTVVLAEKYKNAWPQLEVLKNAHRGKGPALIVGMKKAQGKYVLFTDIDLSVPIAELPKFLLWLKDYNYDLAIATREGVGAKRINEPYMRHFMGRIFNLIVQILVLPGINDTQCGFKLFKKSVINDIFSRARLYTDKDPIVKGGRVGAFDVEILFIARKLGLSIKEVPVTWIYGESSKVHRLKDSFFNTLDVLKVRLNSY